MSDEMRSQAGPPDYLLAAIAAHDHKLHPNGPTRKLDFRTPIVTGVQGSQEYWIGPLTRLNVFVGANNSGKSRILRTLFAELNQLISVQKAIASGIADSRPRLQTLETGLARLIGPGTSQTLSRAPAKSLLGLVQQVLDTTPKASAPEERDVWKCAHESQQPRRMMDQLLGETGQGIAPVKDLVQNELGARFVTPVDINRVNRVYVPALRFTRAFVRDWNPDDALKHSVIDQYFPQARHAQQRPGQREEVKYHFPAPQHIETGQDFYSKFRRHLLGPLDEREMMKEYQAYLSKWFFDGQPIAFIPKEQGSHGNENHTLYVKIGEEQEQPVHHLGDGVSQILVLTYPLFRFRDEHLLLFVEEPENYLHPGYQRRLIDAFVKAPEHGGVPLGTSATRQIFVTTHSSQFLDLTLESDDVCVFGVSKSVEGQSGKQKLPTITVSSRSDNHTPLLRELGVRNTSVLLANCTIWVEGISDRMYLRHYLRLVAEAEGRPEAIPKEDIHYTIAEFGGANLVHWDFSAEGTEAGELKTKVSRLCGEAFVVSDKDTSVNGGDDAKSRRLTVLKEVLDDRLYVLPVREAENLVLPAVLTAVVRRWGFESGAESELQPFEHVEYEQESLGSFIHSRIMPKGVVPKRQFCKGGTAWAKRHADPSREALNSTTIENKVEFAQLVIEQTQTAADLSDFARDLARAALQFIRSKNS